jgi:hypothetical protein
MNLRKDLLFHKNKFGIKAGVRRLKAGRSVSFAFGPETIHHNMRRPKGEKPVMSHKTNPDDESLDDSPLEGAHPFS